jgi:cullin 3
MKHRRVAKYNALIDETIRMCTIFTPQIPLIKKRIETLIEKGYFKRDETDR